MTIHEFVKFIMTMMFLLPLVIISWTAAIAFAITMWQDIVR